MKDLVIRLQQDPEFPELYKKIKELQPQIPAHTLKPDNTDLWKYRSAERHGFDTLLHLLQIKLE